MPTEVGRYCMLFPLAEWLIKLVREMCIFFDSYQPPLLVSNQNLRLINR